MWRQHKSKSIVSFTASDANDAFFLSQLMIGIITDYKDMKYDSDINCASLYEASKVHYF